jgi:hypothetical protein
MLVAVRVEDEHKATWMEVTWEGEIVGVPFFLRQMFTDLGYPAMKKRVTNAKIACLDINLQKARMQLGVQILVEDPNQVEEIRKRLVFKIIDHLALV